MNTPTTGILLLCHKSPSYARMAFNFLLSLRFHGCHLPVAVITDGCDESAGIIGAKAGFWEQVQRIPLPANVPNIAFYLKTRLFDLSPFDRTFFFDADSICISNPEGFFSGNHRMPGTMVTRRNFLNFDRFTWAEGKKVKAYYGIPEDCFWLESNSSILAFDRSDLCRDLFGIAEELYAANPYPDWQGTVGFYPDELAFNAAYSILNHDPEFAYPVMCFPHPNGGLPKFRNLQEDYWFMGLYGNKESVHPYCWEWYNNQVMRHGQELIQEPGFRISVKEKTQSGGAQRRYMKIREFQNEGVKTLIQQYLHGGK